MANIRKVASIRKSGDLLLTSFVARVKGRGREEPPRRAALSANSRITDPPKIRSSLPP
jgi:hypothetical protein